MLEIAASMEIAGHRDQYQPVSQAEDLNVFKVMLMHCLFSTTVGAIRVNLRRGLSLATTEEKIAICLCIAADILAGQDDMEKATMFLALAFRYPQVAESWVGQLPDIVDLHRKLQKSLSPAVFTGLWEQGQTLDISIAAKAVADWLDTWALSVPVSGSPRVAAPVGQSPDRRIKHQ